ncbi:MAG: TIGR04053 family radical SAM/SPASM domain-containing protein [Pirellulales bacterium]|nr:TIGR04053 family radical SAM/SPASM domain-containing protein [Pirellulales bacterium]
MVTVDYTRSDFDRSPFVVFYEVTRACDLVCQHCRASAQPRRDPLELDGEQARQLLGQLASFPKPPMLIFTGGDPLKRADVVDLVRHAVDLGLNAAMTPSATPLVTPEALRNLHEAGLHRLAVSLDGMDAATHDALRGVSGSFQRTIQIMADARRIGLPLQVNTTVTQANLGQIDTLAEMLAGERIVLWSVFFLVPVGRGEQLKRISPEQYEAVFEKLWFHAQRQPYGIKTTEAPHYRRFVLARRGNPRHKPDELDQTQNQRAPLGINDGKGVMFIDHRGAIYPSGFLPLRCGRFPRDSVIDVYQNSPIFRQLRDANQLKGKCGRCGFRHACGGSRARTYAVTGDALAPEPDCVYIPDAAGSSRSSSRR